MNFEELLVRAKAGNEEAIQEILEMYKPRILRESFVDDVFDEDLYQELCLRAWHCIMTFKVKSG